MVNFILCEFCLKKNQKPMEYNRISYMSHKKVAKHHEDTNNRVIRTPTKVMVFELDLKD